MWYTSHCTQKCECDEDDGIGKLDCSDEGCDDDNVCLPDLMGRYYCTSTGNELLFLFNLYSTKIFASQVSNLFYRFQ